MNLSELEQHVFAYYVANGAQALNMDPRFWPYGELVLIIEDKIKFATKEFGVEVALTCPRVAHEFLDILIERKGFSRVENSPGHTMHSYQTENYRNCVNQLLATNAIILEAQGAGPSFWREAFARLSDGDAS